MAARYGYTMGRREMRRNRRAARPHLRVVLGPADSGATEHDVLNWSLGGVLVAAGDTAGTFAAGAVLSGVLKRATAADQIGFTATVIRGEAESGHLALMFEALDEGLFAFFERCAAAALKR